jgi:ATP-dependent Lon protease
MYINYNYENYKINNLTEDYILISSYIQKFQHHIEMCYNNYIIKLYAKNNYFKILNDCIKQLNITHNTLIISNDKPSPLVNSMLNNKIINTNTNTNTNTNSNSNTNTNTNTNTNFKSTHTFLQIYDTITKIHQTVNYPYDKITNTLIQKIACLIGFPDINIALSMIINPNYRYFFNENTNKLLLFYNSIFVPLSYSTKENNINDVNNVNDVNDDQITVEQIDMDNFTLLHNCANILIKYNGGVIVLAGYFIFDSLNIIMRTAELSNRNLFCKKKKIEEIIFDINTNTNTNINIDFAKSYIRNASICEIIAMTEQEYVNKLIENYNLYNKLLGLNLGDIMTEFIKEGLPPKKCLINMFNIIKLLLLGHNNNGANIAEFLFAIIEEKKIGIDILSPSEIIYKNLNYFLQLKLKKTTHNINIEINKLTTLSDETLTKQIIISKNMPLYVKKLAMEKAEEMKNGGSDHYKQSLYVKTLVNYPWTILKNSENLYTLDNSENIFPGINENNRKEFLNGIVDGLEQKVCGHKECKNKIKELVGKWTINSFGNGSVIGLCGPPGVGKTLIAKAIGEVLGFPFVQINLGGQNDVELLCGHGYSYSSAQPGMIVKKMIEAGDPRCIMYFDELDKTNSRNDNNEILNILIHITDPLTNSEFQDRFFQGINFPLNKVLFIFSYNDKSNIDKILLDRIEEIYIGAFKLADKKEIVNKFVIKEMCDMICLNKNLIEINDDVITFIIENYTNEAGIRSLKRKFEKIFLKLNIDIIYGVIDKNELINKNELITITKEYVRACLGNNNIDIVRVHENDTVGVINGLYATSNGDGGILPIQVYENFTSKNDKLILKMTGSLKKVMQQSSMCALTTAMNYIRDDIRNHYMNKSIWGFHLHLPSTSTVKDGPSGSAAVATAFISQILNKKIKHECAVTGEIDLVGNVLKIGGLEYKLPGAKKAGVKLVLVPEENEDDIIQIKKDYPDLFINFEVKLVKTLKDVLKYMIVNFDENDIVVK